LDTHHTYAKPNTDTDLILQWSRLLSPLSSGPTRKDHAKDPAKRLHRFEKEYGNLLVASAHSLSLKPSKADF
jgi:hypothetical protein